MKRTLQLSEDGQRALAALTESVLRLNSVVNRIEEIRDIDEKDASTFLQDMTLEEGQIAASVAFEALQSLEDAGVRHTFSGDEYRQVFNTFRASIAKGRLDRAAHR